MPSLEINCLGPFAFYFHYKGCKDPENAVYVLVPNSKHCANHYLNVITDEADVAIDSQMLQSKSTTDLDPFVLTNVVSGQFKLPNTPFLGNAIYEPWPAKLADGTNLTSTLRNKWRFAFKLNWPDDVLGMLPVQASVKDAGGNTEVVVGYYARGLRLLYTVDAAYPPVFNLSKGIDPDGLVLPDTLILCRVHDRQNVLGCEIRYSNPNLAPNSTDAADCFTAIVENLQGYNGWQLSQAGDGALAPKAEERHEREFEGSLDKLFDWLQYRFNSPNGHPQFCGAVVIAFHTP